jgi:hypothetical protein
LPRLRRGRVISGFIWPSNERGPVSLVLAAHKGFANSKVIAYMKALGVTSVQLSPIHAFINDSGLLERGLTNYWGYNSIEFFAPDSRYAHEPEQTLREFKVALFAPGNVDEVTGRSFSMFLLAAD